MSPPFRWRRREPPPSLPTKPLSIYYYRHKNVNFIITQISAHKKYFSYFFKPLSSNNSGSSLITNKSGEPNSNTQFSN